MREYRDATAFRRALEERLKREAPDRGVALDRLRKLVAHERLLARCAAVAPPGSWALKGGIALIARLGAKARATKDADVTWRQSTAALEELVEGIIDCDLKDFFEYEIGAPRSLDAESLAGGLRYPVAVRIGGREFERLQLDVNVVVDDPRSTEVVELPTMLAFAGLAPVAVPMIRIEQHLAEKIHAYCRDYGGRPSGRPKDLFDMLRIAEHPLPVRAAGLRRACRETFELRGTPWPPTVPPPPFAWVPVWREFVREHGIPWRSLDEAYNALVGFWGPVMGRPAAMQWAPTAWSWTRADDDASRE